MRSLEERNIDQIDITSSYSDYLYSQQFKSLFLDYIENDLYLNSKMFLPIFDKFFNRQKLEEEEKNHILRLLDELYLKRQNLQWLGYKDNIVKEFIDFWKEELNYNSLELVISDIGKNVSDAVGENIVKIAEGNKYVVIGISKTGENVQSIDLSYFLYNKDTGRIERDITLKVFDGISSYIKLQNGENIFIGHQKILSNYLFSLDTGEIISPVFSHIKSVKILEEGEDKKTIIWVIPIGKLVTVPYCIETRAILDLKDYLFENFPESPEVTRLTEFLAGFDE